MRITERKLRDVAREIRRSVGVINNEEALLQALPLAIEKMSSMAEHMGVSNAREIAEKAVEKTQASVGLLSPGRKFREFHKAIAKALKDGPHDLEGTRIPNVSVLEKMGIQPPSANELAAAVHESLFALKQRRPIFHSEGDLRHELGWELSRRGILNVRAEKPFDDKEIGVGRVDLAAAGFVSELKYFTTTKLQKIVDGEKFVVAGAPHRRGAHYNFWEDVWRVEQLVRNNRLQFGCVVCVANYPSMWEDRVRDSDRWMADFWMVDGKTFPRVLTLGKEKRAAGGKWTNREGIRLLKEYTLKWEEWHNFPGMKDGRFRYLVVEVWP